MCGIFGRISFGPTIDRDLLILQRDTLTHRGPDSAGDWISENGLIGLGHRRLAIIDLSSAGHQPMIDRTTGTVITFNGEIYNFRALRDKLRSFGHNFNSSSDTEVILTAYRQWGSEFIGALDGMFAFALFDVERKTMLIGRDRAGEKPLYMYRDSSSIQFASEIKAIIADPDVPRCVRRDSLNEFLAYGYVPSPYTMFDGISKLEAGTLLEINVRSGTHKKTQYWQLPNYVDSSPLDQTANPSNEFFVDRVHELLKRSVSMQLVADVPTGVLLSGGVDSSLIAAIASEVSDKKIRTFTARFSSSSSFDEGPFARMVAEHFGTEHTEIETPPTTPELLERLVTQFDDPIADSSMIPTFLICEEIRKHATVALGGDGGDELFAGYRHYPIQLKQQRQRNRIPRFLGNVLSSTASKLLHPGIPGRGFAMTLGDNPNLSFSNPSRLFRIDERRMLSKSLAFLSDVHLSSPERLRETAMSNRTDALQRATAIDFSYYMPDDVLAKVDRSSMLASLEVRAPFLDRSVIECAFGELPTRLRATPAKRKVILRELGKRLLPRQLDLTRKQGFDIPVDQWMTGVWQPLLNDITLRANSIIEDEAIIQYAKRLQQGNKVGERLFALMSFRMWEDLYRVTNIV